jgi:hypothetical protein
MEEEADDIEVTDLNRSCLSWIFRALIKKIQLHEDIRKPPGVIIGKEGWSVMELHATASFEHATQNMHRVWLSMHSPGCPDTKEFGTGGYWRLPNSFKLQGRCDVNHVQDSSPDHCVS